MRFKIEILVDGDPGVSQKHSGTFTQLKKEMTGKAFNSCRKYFPVLINSSRQLRGIAIKIKSVVYLISKTR